MVRMASYPLSPMDDPSMVTDYPMIEASRELDQNTTVYQWSCELCAKTFEHLEDAQTHEGLCRFRQQQKLKMEPNYKDDSYYYAISDRHSGTKFSTNRSKSTSRYREYPDRQSIFPEEAEYFDIHQKKKEIERKLCESEANGRDWMDTRRRHKKDRKPTSRPDRVGYERERASSRQLYNDDFIEAYKEPSREDRHEARRHTEYYERRERPERVQHSRESYDASPHMVICRDSHQRCPPKHRPKDYEKRLPKYQWESLRDDRRDDDNPSYDMAKYSAASSPEYKTQKKWACDKCRGARFRSYVDAYVHEKFCEGKSTSRSEPIGYQRNSWAGGDDRGDRRNPRSLPPATVRLRSSEVSRNAWTEYSHEPREKVKYLCSVCEEALFSNYEEAVQHERRCHARRRRATSSSYYR